VSQIEKQENQDKQERLILASCDTQTLMWAFPWPLIPKKLPASERARIDEMRQRARMLMKLLDQQKVKIIIPSVVVAELIMPIDPSKHARILLEFSSQFFCPPFDVSACSLAARLWQFERGLPGGKAGLPEKEQSVRKVLKSDILIVATAKIAGAVTFYSNDKKARRLADESGMEGKDLPTTSGDWIVDWEIKSETT
jgi:hypothetical protein